MLTVNGGKLVKVFLLLFVGLWVMVQGLFSWCRVTHSVIEKMAVTGREKLRLGHVAEGRDDYS
jgi:hypothetical protein